MRKLVVFLLIFSCLPAFAASPNVKKQECSTQFSIITQDHLGNVHQGGPESLTKWLIGLKKKYPSACYVPYSDDVKTMLYITIVPDTYNGTRRVADTSQDEGTVTTQNGETATYRGNSTSSHSEQYSFKYGRYKLAVETLDKDGKVVVHQRFSQDGVYSTLYGIPLGGRGHHPDKAVIEDAVKWIQSGGLSDSNQFAK